MSSAGPTETAAKRATSGLTALAAVWVAAGCATDVPDYMPDADEGSRHAVISVQRSTAIGEDEPATAEAFAQFAQVPVTNEPSQVLGLTGVARELPAVSSCRVRESGEFEGPLTSMGRVELLDVGQVSIEVEDDVTVLSAHAFPTVSDFVSGVVYATPDRDAHSLPADTRYAVHVAGSGTISPLTLTGEAPPPLESVTLGGVPIEEIAHLVSGEPIDVTWAVGEPTDLVFVEILSQDEASGVTCSFQDVEGAGTVPAAVIPAVDTVRLSVHRLRIAQVQDAELDSGEVRFDFELSTTLPLQ